MWTAAIASRTLQTRSIFFLQPTISSFLSHEFCFFLESHSFSQVSFNVLILQIC